MHFLHPTMHERREQERGMDLQECHEMSKQSSFFSARRPVCGRGGKCMNQASKQAHLFRTYYAHIAPVDTAVLFRAFLLVHRRGANPQDISPRLERRVALGSGEQIRNGSQPPSAVCPERGEALSTSEFFTNLKTQEAVPLKPVILTVMPSPSLSIT